MAFDPVSIALEVGSKLIDRLWPDPEKRDAAKLELYKIEKSGELSLMMADTDLAKGQLDVNKAEAASGNVFVSGWRPFIGWICGAGLASQFIVGPFLTWGAAIFGKTIVFPVLDMGTLLTLLFGMLGLGAMRSYDKKQGTA